MINELPKYRRVLVRDNASLARACERLSLQPLTACDSETTDLDPWIGRLRLIQIAAPELQETYIFDLDYLTELEPLRRFFLDPKPLKVFHNAAFDTKYVLRHLSQGLRRVYPESVLDTMLASQLVTPFGTLQPRGYHSLGQVALRYCNITVDKEEQRSDWSGEISESQLDYAYTDAEILVPVVYALAARIDETGMTEGWMVENRCVLATAMLELMGTPIDLDEIKRLELELDAKMAQLETSIAEFLPRQQLGLFGVEPINLRSSPQMKLGLRDRFVEALLTVDRKQAKRDGFTTPWNEVRAEGYSKLQMHKFDGTRSDRPCAACGLSKLNPAHIDSKSSEVIKNYRPLNPELIDMLCDYSTLAQAYTTYCVGLPEKRHPVTGRFHANYRQLGQPQHRYQTTNPNLLNIPKTLKYGPDAPEHSVRHSKRSFRDCFRAEAGHKLITADYSSLQMRLTAARANERRMIEVIREHDLGRGPDIHTATAMFVTGKLIDEISKLERFESKSLNFAVLFGAGPQRLQDYLRDTFGLILSFQQCVDLRVKYLMIYADLARYHEEQRRRVETEGKVWVPGGGVVLLAPGTETATVALNFPAVLSEQLGIKDGMSEIIRWLIREQEDGWLSTYCYDELILHMKESAAERAATMLERLMQTGMQKYVEGDEVKIYAKAEIVDSWAQKK